MKKREICICGVVLGELLQGAKKKKHREKIKHLKDVCEFITDNPDIWIEAGELSRELRGKGNTIGLIDCFLAIVAKNKKLKIWTLDKNFEIIATHLKISYLFNL